MKKHIKNKYIKMPLIAALSSVLAYSYPITAQITNEAGDQLSLEEIVVTGRKREESLQEIPVSISVLGANELAELNVLRQDDLAALVPGFFYNQGVGLNEDRNAALPSIRGIGSTELATNRSKVASFVDGMPILGSVGAINIGGSAQVEVYRGPQSAAFGRSTFAGAINYVTRDPGDTFEGTVGVNWSDDGTRIVNGSVGGPITETLGFQINANIEDSTSPDTPLYSYTDGVEALTETGENLSARLVFTPNDKFKVKLTFAHDTTDDGPRSDFYASAESSFDCYNSLDLFQVYTMTMANQVGVDGVYECELEPHPDTVLEQLNDYRRYFANNPDEFEAVVQGLRDDGAEDNFFGQGLTVEEQALIIYDGYSVAHDDAGSDSERNRITAQFDYLFDNGSGAQLSIMRSEEDLFRGYSRVAEQEVQPLSFNAMAGYYDNYAATVNAMGMVAPNNRRAPDNDPTTIEETYMEVRWASPAEDRMRYVLGASYYDYEYIYTEYGDPGYNTLANGTSDLFALMIDPGELVNSGGEVAPTTIQSEVTTDVAVFFNASYDFTDTITGSIEGRYAKDDVGAVLPLAGLEESVNTSTFTPRIGLNWTPNETTTYYLQYAVGVNPAGINANMLDPLLTSTLDVGIPIDLDPTDDDPTTTLVPANANYDSSRYLYFDEEKLTNYEFGFKGEGLDGRLTYAGAIYYMEWESALENIALDWDYEFADNDFTDEPTLVTSIDPNGPAGVYYVPENENTSVNQIFTNSGISDTMGIEIQASYQINDSWSISGNAALMTRKFTDYCSEDDFTGPNDPTDGIDGQDDYGAHAGLVQGISEGGNPCWELDGLHVADQPPLTLSIIPRYRTELGNGFRLNASATLRHTAQHYSEFSNTTEDPEVNTVSLNFGLSKDAWSASLYIDNLLDDRGLIPRGATNLARFDQLNAPAEIPDELVYDFFGTEQGSWRLNPNIGRSFGLRMNYDF